MVLVLRGPCPWTTLCALHSVSRPTPHAPRQPKVSPRRLLRRPVGMPVGTFVGMRVGRDRVYQPAAVEAARVHGPQEGRGHPASRGLVDLAREELTGQREGRLPRMLARCLYGRSNAAKRSSAPLEAARASLLRGGGWDRRGRGRASPWERRAAQSRQARAEEAQGANENESWGGRSLPRRATALLSTPRCARRARQNELLRRVRGLHLLEICICRGVAAGPG